MLLVELAVIFCINDCILAAIYHIKLKAIRKGNKNEWNNCKTYVYLFILKKTANWDISYVKKVISYMGYISVLILM